MAMLGAEDKAVLAKNFRSMPQRDPLCFLPRLLCDGAVWSHRIGALDRDFRSRFIELSRHDSMPAMAA